MIPGMLIGTLEYLYYNNYFTYINYDYDNDYGLYENISKDWICFHYDVRTCIDMTTLFRFVFQLTLLLCL